MAGPTEQILVYENLDLLWTQTFDFGWTDAPDNLQDQQFAQFLLDLELLMTHWIWSHVVR